MKLLNNILTGLLFMILGGFLMWTITEPREMTIYTADDILYVQGKSVQTESGKVYQFGSLQETAEWVHKQTADSYNRDVGQEMYIYTVSMPGGIEKTAVTINPKKIGEMVLLYYDAFNEVWVEYNDSTIVGNPDILWGEILR